ncbi:MAG: alpha/beta hydrolase [Erysipelotrichaceae bacterium]|nr:alpha/beta hydrolase [Erysipelotrichaceae bacterium]
MSYDYGDMTKYTEILGVKTAYLEEGSGNDVILLHGWGQNKEMMGKILEHLSDRFHVYSLDFPGFGESQDPPEAWGVPEYEDFLASFIETLGIENPVLIGHSFGCRVAIRYAADHPDNVRKMCLTGAAGIKPKRGLDYQIRTKMYKAGKWFLKTTGQTEKLEELQNRSGSEDYRNAKGIMRPTFVKVVNDDVTDVLPLVKCSVLLVWGDQDTAAPLWMGQMMEKTMPDAGLAIFAGDDHWAYWHQPDRFNRVLDIFLKGDAQ